MKRLIYGAVALGVLALPAAALAHPPRPHTVPFPADAMFGGSVNGANAHATIHMACFGPTRPGRTGHPMAHQKVGVFIPEAMMSPTFGRTGARVSAVGVSIVARGHRVGPFTWFRRLALTWPVRTASAPLPTELTLPCSGTGTAVFTPVPGGKPATVDLAFAGQP